MNESFRILIVEDEHIVALDLQHQVEKLGHDVVGIAGTGTQAINLALDTHPDLVLMDIRLHGDMDGIAAATEIRSVEPIPIVYLTAYTDAKTLERASVTQPLGYILKPFQLRELETTIQLALYKSKVQAELNQYTRQLDSIMRYATDGFVLIDSGANILRMNSKAEAYLQLLNHQFDHPLQALGEYSIDSFLGDNQSNTWTIHAPESEHVFEITVSEGFTSSTTSNTDEASRLFVIRDITLQQRMQRENEENARMAAIGQLAAGIAHDFNNILGVILTQVGIIKMSQANLTDKTRDHLSGIQYHVTRATDLITQVLDFTRSSHLDMNPLKVYPLLNELVKLINRTFPKSIDIEFAHESSDFWITGDPTRISQAIMNLVIRARDAMVTGGQLLISIEGISSSLLPTSIASPNNIDNWIRIRVEDTGEPIDATVIPHIFDPLVDPENTQRGLSMQLAQTGGIVEQHEGYIVVDTQPNRTVFEIFLPELSKTHTEQPAEEDTLIHEERSGKLTVLLVEDDNSLRDTMIETLELFDYTVISAVNGLEGLEKFQDYRSTIDIVLTDMIMPNMDGLQMCREIRKFSESVPLVITSGYSSHTYDEIEDIEIAAWLKKPIDIETLNKTLRNHANVMNRIN